LGKREGSRPGNLPLDIKKKGGRKKVRERTNSPEGLRSQLLLKLETRLQTDNIIHIAYIRGGKKRERRKGENGEAEGKNYPPCIQVRKR